MCGRYMITTSLEAIQRLFQVSDRPNLAARYNVAPTQRVPIVRLQPERAGRELVLVRWGLIPHWAKDAKIGNRLINARAESVARTPAFRDAFRHRRCLVVADGFYEWRTKGGPRHPYLVRMASREPFAFAGLWAWWRSPEGEGVESCTIVTTTANPLLATIHDRMPVVLAPADYEAWLEADSEEAQALLEPSDDAELEVVAVSDRVNNVRNDDADVIAPIGERLRLP